MTKRTKKILANVSKPLIEKLNEKVSAGCLQRDAYLDHVFSHEAKMLGEEIDEPNSPEARDHLVKHLGLLDRKSVNFSLRPETVAVMDEVCKLKNIPRDAFINRVVLFLVAERAFFQKIIGIDLKWYWDRHMGSNVYSAPYPLDGALSAIKDLVTDDPFWAVRICIEEAKSGPDDYVDPLHKIHIPGDLFSKNFKSSLGFNCYLADGFIEGHPAEKAWKDELDKLFEEFTHESEPKKSGVRK